MENWPEYAICETTVVFEMVLSREIERNVGNFFVDNFLCCYLAMRRDFSTPAKPNAGFLFQGSIDRYFKAAGARACTSFRNSNSIRDYDKLPQRQSFPVHI